MGPRANPAPKSQFEPITLHCGTIWAEKVTEKISVQNRFIQLSTLFLSSAGQSSTNKVLLLAQYLRFGKSIQVAGYNGVRKVHRFLVAKRMLSMQFCLSNFNFFSEIEQHFASPNVHVVHIELLSRPKMFLTGSNFLSQTKNWFTHCRQSETFCARPIFFVDER